MMIRFANLAFFLMLISLNVQAKESLQKEHLFEILVYKTPSCGCCKKWMSHLKNEDIDVFSQDYSNISFIKNKYDIKPRYRSCHTAVTSQGYIFEGHVPAKFIKKFISESPPLSIGLSVPSMPVGSPGMEMGERFMPYKVLVLFKDGSSKVYAEVNTYEEQY